MNTHNRTPLLLHARPNDARGATVLCGMPDAMLISGVGRIDFHTGFVEILNDYRTDYTYSLCPDCLECLPLLAISEMGL